MWATPTGGKITDNGAIEGGSGIISHNVDNNGLLGVGGESNLRLTGVLTNAADGEILERFVHSGGSGQAASLQPQEKLTNELCPLAMFSP